MSLRALLLAAGLICASLAQADTELVMTAKLPNGDTVPYMLDSASPAPKYLLAGNNNKYLYHNSTLALDADTGKIKWYYQHLVDHWDLDHPFERLLVDTAVTPDARTNDGDATRATVRRTQPPRPASGRPVVVPIARTTTAPVAVAMTAGAVGAVLAMETVAMADERGSMGATVRSG